MNLKLTRRTWINAALVFPVTMLAGCIQSPQARRNSFAIGKVEALRIRRLPALMPRERHQAEKAWASAEIDRLMQKYLIRNLNRNGLKAHYTGISGVGHGDVLTESALQVDLSFANAFFSYANGEVATVTNLQYVAVVSAPVPARPIDAFLEFLMPSNPLEPNERYGPDQLTKRLIGLLEQRGAIAAGHMLQYAD